MFQSMLTMTATIFRTQVGSLYANSNVLFRIKIAFLFIAFPRTYFIFHYLILFPRIFSNPLFEIVYITGRATYATVFGFVISVPRPRH